MRRRAKCASLPVCHLSGPADGRIRSTAEALFVAPMACSLRLRFGMSTQIQSRIDQFMTPHPTCIRRKQHLSEAHERMQTLQVRHLPVLEEDGRLVGILSQRDIYFTEALHERPPESARVEDAMTSNPYVVPPERPVGEVAAKMVEGKLGCAVVASGERVVGIFTTTDALRILMGIVQAWL
jgi:CBS domain-containing protein